MSTTPNSLESSRARVERLVEHFRTNLDAYKNSAYNETQTRREFIDPFFKALGWDVDNEAGYAPAYKDVIHEDAIKIGGFTKAPDYCFRIGGQRKFFVEAKKPFVDMKHDPVPYYQLRRYGFSAKLPLSIVTDFEELAIVDCRAKPSPNDKASTGRIRYWRYDEYLEHFEEIYNTFSKEAVLTGSFDRSIASAKTKRGTGEVDKEFLKEIESWRDELARNIARRNPGLTQRQLNEAVQVTIDRIIFLRICEDRGIEEYGVLQGMQNGTNVYPRLCQLFQRADERYNSGLFHFKDEKNRPGHPDDLTLNLTIDDKTLKQILKGLYYPDSPYEFSVLPADILGQVYEQFLGKVIRLTAGHQAKVEDKPEVKKAGGVYYTPTYIVDYIVKNTVGKLLAGSTPKKAQMLKVLDPACGSGSFLIGAYEFLLDWHRDWYTENDAQKWAQGREPRLFMGKACWQLTTAEKKRILLNNIHGVDIDPQAVEVTKLSLLLKVLEEENQESINAQLKFFRERALPDLSRNIKCGNSLIGTDFYEGQQMGMLDEEEQMRINVFDWDGPGGFPEIMKAGGFDAVIGNPPYVRIQAMKEWAPVEVEHYKKRYTSAEKGNYDIYVVFVERGLSLLNKNGLLGFILPHKFFNAQYGMALRALIAQGKYLSHIVHFGHQQVFDRATTYTCLMFLDKRGVDQVEFIRVDDLSRWLSNPLQADIGIIPERVVSDKEWNFIAGEGTQLFLRLNETFEKLGEIVDIYVGLQTSADDVFILDFVDEQPGTLRLKSKALGNERNFEKKLFFPLVSGTDVKRYAELPARQFILFPYRIISKKAELIEFDEIQTQFPETAAYLLENKLRLEGREKGRLKGKKWHGYIYLKNMAKQGVEKVCVPRLVEDLHAAYDFDGSHFLDNVDVGGITVKQEYRKHRFEFLLGLLNSKLLRWYFPFVSAPFRGGWLSANKQFLSQIPISLINFDNPTDKFRHDQIVELVERMLDLNKRLHAAKTAHEKDTLQRQIDSTDRQIDRLVYELYGLTEDEINIVEAGTSK